MKRTKQSLSRQLTFVILLTSGSLLLIGGSVVAVTDIGPEPFMIMLGASTVLCTYASWYASRYLVSRPMLCLARTVESVSAAEDFSVRVTKRSQDEVGLLVDNLNNLLARIEERDRHYRGEGDRLEAEVSARTRELRQSNEQLEAATAEAIAASDAKSQFIANMTHEIRTPMNGVLGMTELLMNTDLAPQQQRFARTVVESGEDLLAIINNILDFSKVSQCGQAREDRQSALQPAGLCR